MADTSLKAHIPQEADPKSLMALVELMYKDDIYFPTVKSLLAFTEEQGIGSRTELQIFGTAIGVLSKDSDGVIHLSDNAHTIVQTKPEVRADVLHFLNYSGWRDELPRKHTELWAYREVSNAYWSRVSVNVVSTAPAITEEIRNKAYEVFKEDVSFSPKSIRGVRKWLEAITPPIIEGNTFTRRHFCYPELALLATGWVAQRTEGEIGIDYLLTPVRREAICQLCLLDPSALDRVLDWMLPNYPDIVQPGTSAGTYGRFLRFLKWPEISDLLP